MRIALTILLMCAAACGGQLEIAEFRLGDEPPLEVGQETKLYAVVAYPPGGEVEYRWTSRSGECVPEVAGQPETTYRALRAGRDQIMLQVLRDNAVIHESSLEIEVVESQRILPVAPSTAQTGSLSIEITEFPPYDPIGGGDSNATIAGVVRGASTRHRVLLYACTNVCYVQPLVQAYLTPIGEDGRWSTWTHTGRQYVVRMVDETCDDAPATLPNPRTELATERCEVLARLVVRGRS